MSEDASRSTSGLEVGAEPFWESKVMQNEPVFFIEEEGGDGCARLLFAPEAVQGVTSASGEVVFEQGRDYMVGGRERFKGSGGEDDQVRLVMRLPGSRLPVTRRMDLVKLWDSKRDEFHSRQAVITYRHAPGLWRGPVPQFAGERLPRTMGRLRGAEPLTISLTGDSIAEGYGASGFSGVAPHQPPFGLLMVGALERLYGSRVAFHNFGGAGWGAEHGLYVEDVVAPKPDLVMVAYGTNDAGFAGPREFSSNIQDIIGNVRQSLPLAEFILVSPLLPNPEWDYPVHAWFPEYRDALARLCGLGVVLADMTTLWMELLRWKGYYDLTGNGLNHPNDFGHRLYAQTILGLLVDANWKGRLGKL